MKIVLPVKRGHWKLSTTLGDKPTSRETGFAATTLVWIAVNPELAENPTLRESRFADAFKPRAC